MASSSTPPNVDVEIGKMLLKINSNIVASCERGKKLSTCLIINCNVAPTGGKLPSLLERQRVRKPENPRAKLEKLWLITCGRNRRRKYSPCCGRISSHLSSWRHNLWSLIRSCYNFIIFFRDRVQLMWQRAVINFLTSYLNLIVK